LPSAASVDWLRSIPYIVFHFCALSVFWVGISPVAVWTAVILYVLRMFAITGFYHRYFSHRAFRTSRTVQFLFAFLGTAAAQRGPLWWASHHRHHHRHADEQDDPHSPVQQGFLWSHVGWFLSPDNVPPRQELIQDWLEFPELRWLERHENLAPLLLAIGLLGLGEGLRAWMPHWHTNGVQLLVWGFVISTLAVYHATYTVNSLAHGWGRRRYPTRDDSRNNAILAVLTLGEGWHNNHHHYPVTVRQGFYWWEIDLTYYLLRLMASLHLVWDLKPLPAAVREARAPARDGRA